MKKIKEKKYLEISIVLLVIFSIYAIGYLTNESEKDYLLGKAYESQGYYGKAKVSYEKSIKSEKDSVVYNALGNLNVIMGENFEAIEMFKKGMNMDQTDVENFYDLSRLYIDLGEYSKAEQTLVRIIEESASVYALFGTIYIETNKWDQAETAFKKSLELQEIASTYNDLGVVYENKGDYNLAIENYQHALTLDPQFGLARNNINRLQGQNNSSTSIIKK